MTASVDLPEPYPDDTEFPYWVPEPGQQISVRGPGVVSIELTARWRSVDPETARATAAALLAAAQTAEELNARSFPCVVDGCPHRFVTYDALNRHSRSAHVQTTKRYPGADASGDFTWHHLP
ncbi:hypothetical protein PP556_14570 [Mycobacteroides abscessus]|nr:hypothetical protein [Mycobacteroides abscessus]MDM2451153.1 hypothetical protein [Mycobacteroides abscessus]MDM2455701.1 hypothetical protein [Mycobacteroides abscessus]MDM2460453.1 hypothetical protein [Mycobacteroides abscessus]MDM2466115.1 hypothetical protein [Mycobacteroides abscessus]